MVAPVRSPGIVVTKVDPEVYSRLNALEGEIQTVSDDLGIKIQTVSNDLGGKIQAVHTRIDGVLLPISQPIPAGSSPAIATVSHNAKSYSPDRIELEIAGALLLPEPELAERLARKNIRDIGDILSFDSRADFTQCILKDEPGLDSETAGRIGAACRILWAAAKESAKLAAAASEAEWASDADDPEEAPPRGADESNEDRS